MSGAKPPKNHFIAFVTEDAYLKGRHIKNPLNGQQIANMGILIERINALLMEPDCPGFFGVSSGYRPASINSAVGGALKSAHLSCEAIDLADPVGVIDKWLVQNPELLLKYDLYLESPTKTAGWCHLQTRRTKSGNRIFLP